jgi:hypothetical protein
LPRNVLICGLKSPPLPDPLFETFICFWYYLILKIYTTKFFKSIQNNFNKSYFLWKYIF